MGFALPSLGLLSAGEGAAQGNLQGLAALIQQQNLQKEQAVKQQIADAQTAQVANTYDLGLGSQKIAQQQADLAAYQTVAPIWNDPNHRNFLRTHQPGEYQRLKATVNTLGGRLGLPPVGDDTPAPLAQPATPAASTPRPLPVPVTTGPTPQLTLPGLTPQAPQYGLSVGNLFSGAGSPPAADPSQPSPSLADALMLKNAALDGALPEGAVWHPPLPSRLTLPGAAPASPGGVTITETTPTAPAGPSPTSVAPPASPQSGAGLSPDVGGLSPLQQLLTFRQGEIDKLERAQPGYTPEYYAGMVDKGLGTFGPVAEGLYNSARPGLDLAKLAFELNKFTQEDATTRRGQDTTAATAAAELASQDPLRKAQAKLAGAQAGKVPAEIAKENAEAVKARADADKTTADRLNIPFENYIKDREVDLKTAQVRADLLKAHVDQANGINNKIKVYNEGQLGAFNAQVGQARTSLRSHFQSFMAQAQKWNIDPKIAASLRATADGIGAGGGFSLGGISTSFLTNVTAEGQEQWDKLVAEQHRLDNLAQNENTRPLTVGNQAELDAALSPIPTPVYNDALLIHQGKVTGWDDTSVLNYWRNTDRSRYIQYRRALDAIKGREKADATQQNLRGLAGAGPVPAPTSDSAGADYRKAHPGPSNPAAGGYSLGPNFGNSGPGVVGR